MDHWKVLPTDPRFRSLTPDMIGLLINGYNQQLKDEELAQKGSKGQTSSFVDMDTDWKNKTDKNGDFDPLEGQTGLMDNVKKLLNSDDNSKSTVGDPSLTTQQKSKQAELAQKSLSNTLKAFNTSNKGGENK